MSPQLLPGPQPNAPTVPDRSGGGTVRHWSGDRRGFGLIDAMATAAMIAIVAAAAMSSFDYRRNDLNTSVRRIIADLRWARARAIVSGDHFRFHATGPHSYQLERLEERDGQWHVRSVLRSAALPDHLSLIPAGGASLDFDSRGLIVFANAALTTPARWTVTDSRFQAERQFTLYPSGQLHSDG